MPSRSTLLGAAALFAASAAVLMVGMVAGSGGHPAQPGDATAHGGSPDTHARPAPEARPEPAPTPTPAPEPDVPELYRGDVEKNIFFGTKGVPTLRAQIEKDPENAILWSRLASELLRAGKHDDAYDACLKARELGRANPPHAAFDTFITWRLAMSALRKAEAENCVARHFPESCIFPLRDRAVHVSRTGAERAREHLLDYLGRELQPLELWRARWLLNVVATALDAWPEAVPEEHRLPFDPFTGSGASQVFPNVARERGLEGLFIPGGSIVVDDLNGDGHLDVLVCGWLPTSKMGLFLNDGTGNFRDATAGSGLLSQRGGIGLYQADYDNDGDLDVFVVRGAQPDPDETPDFDDGRLARNSLLRNRGDGTFEDVTLQAGLGRDFAPYAAAAWGDFDGDGHVDLYVAPAAAEVRYRDHLYRNRGDGTFEDVAIQHGIENSRHAMSAVFCDYDDDGDADLFITNYGSHDRLYRNDGDQFWDIASNVGLLGFSRSHGAWWLDADGDGRQDVIVTSYGIDPGEGAADVFGEPLGAPTPHLYLNRGSAGFEDVTQAWGLDRVWLQWSGNVGDIDNDGWIDFYLGTGGIGFDALFPNVMFRNDGGRRFVDITVDGRFGHLQKAAAVAFGDVDGDGDRELLVRAGGCFRSDGFVNVLFDNPGNENRWLKLLCEGRRSNRAAIGARVTVNVVTADGARRAIRRWVGSGGGFGSSTLRLEVGLGAAKSVESVEVRWPGGKTERFEQIPLDATLRLVEGTARAERVR